MADLLFNWMGFNQTSKYVDDVYVADKLEVSRTVFPPP